MPVVGSNASRNSPKKTNIESPCKIVRMLQDNENLTLEIVKKQCFEAISQVQGQMIELQNKNTEQLEKIRKDQEWIKANLDNVRKEHPARTAEVQDYCTANVTEIKKVMNELDGRLMTTESKINTITDNADKLANKIERQNTAFKEMSEKMNSLRLQDASMIHPGGAHSTVQTSVEKEIGATTSAFLLVGLQSIKRYLDIPEDTDPIETVGRILDENHLYASLDKVIPADMKTAKYRSKSNVAIVYMRNEFMKKEALVSLKRMASKYRDYLGDVVIKDSFHQTKIQEMRDLTKMGMSLKERKDIAKFRILNREGNPVLQVAYEVRDRFTDYTADPNEMIVDVPSISSSSDEELSLDDPATRLEKKKAREQRRKERNEQIRDKGNKATGSNSTPLGKNKRMTDIGNSTQPASISTRGSEGGQRNTGARTKQTRRSPRPSRSNSTRRNNTSRMRTPPRRERSPRRGSPNRRGNNNRQEDDNEQLQKELRELRDQFRAYREETDRNKTYHDEGAAGHTREG